eukprot:3097266-Pyramimonas_sp.AAC.1
MPSWLGFATSARTVTALWDHPSAQPFWCRESGALARPCDSGAYRDRAQGPLPGHSFWRREDTTPAGLWDINTYRDRAHPMRTPSGVEKVLR